MSVGRRPRRAAAYALTLFVLVSSVPAQEKQGDWRRYEVYQPRIERYFVVDARKSRLRYNHCASLAWFGDRWFCLWNGNQTPREGAPDQPCYVSTSRDGMAWSGPVAAFSDGACSENPVPYAGACQWQPNLAVVEGELWALWWQSGGPKENRGTYLSRLAQPDGKWVNRRLLWDGSPEATIAGKPYQAFPSQNPYRLRSGRILAPVVLMGVRPADAPKEAEGWWGSEKRDSVLYTDDLGKTWHASPGCMQPGASWANWEPTVWEQSDGSVMMFARNNRQRDMGAPPKSSEYLLQSISRDGGETWSPHEYVPIESVCSRMHVVPLDGRGVWGPARPGDDLRGRAYLMVHNDAAGADLSWSFARRNVALYLKRGDGFEFVPGIGLTGLEPIVCYPQMWIHEDRLMVCYSEDGDPYRSIKVAHVTPPPDPAKRYLLPRGNDAAASPTPRRSGDVFEFDGDQCVATRERVDPGQDGFGVGAWIRPEDRGVLVDTRGAGGGFVLMLAPIKEATDTDALFHPAVAFPGAGRREWTSSLTLVLRKWQYVGVTVDKPAGRVTFCVDGRSESQPLDAPKAGPFAGDTGYIGFRRPAASGLSGFGGGIRMLAVYPSPRLTADAHHRLYEALSAALGGDGDGTVKDAIGGAVVLFDPKDPEFSRRFSVPEKQPLFGARPVVEGGRELLRFFNEGSAGVDLDENHRGRGDKVAIRFRFRIESGDGHVLCTIGDANEPARLVYRSRHISLNAESGELPCGAAKPNEWTDVEVETSGATTRARVAGGAFAEVGHRPAGTWVFLGEGYPTRAAGPDRSFAVDVASVGTLVTPSAR